jgi:hypothetical protein
MALRSSETEDALLNRLVAEIGSDEASLRLAAQEAWDAFPHSLRALWLTQLLKHRDGLKTFRLTLAVPYAIGALLGSGFFLMWMEQNVPLATFGAFLLAGVPLDALKRRRNLFAGRRYDAWLDTLQDARLAPYALPGARENIWDKDSCAMRSRARLLKRLLPQLTEEDFLAWTPEQHDRLFHLLDRLNAFYDTDLTVVILTALPKINDPRVSDCLRRFASYSQSDFIWTGPIERTGAIRYGLERINEAARNALPQDILLRASTAPDAKASEELLRPAAASETTPPEQLLRPRE